MPADTTRRFRFPRSRRLSGRRAFEAVYACRASHRAGPLVVCGRPNGLSHARLGLSVSRRVGSAVQRNRIKRLLREAFRLSQHDWPAYDVVIVVRKHETLRLENYRDRLTGAVGALRGVWEARAAKQPAAIETLRDESIRDEAAEGSQAARRPGEHPVRNPTDAPDAV